MRKLIRDINDIKAVIEKLRESIKKGELETSFGLRVDIEKVNLFETAFGVRLPASFKVFLSELNGGFIANEEANWYWLNEGFDEAERYSNRFLDLDEIIEEYESLSIDKWKLIPELDGIYPYIPFFITNNGEKLVFVDYPMPGECGVFYAIHDEPASDWTMIAKDFTDFFEFYINSNGEIPNEDVDPTIRAESFLWMQNQEWRKERDEDPEEIVKRCTAYLSFFPKDVLSYTSRANAYADLNQYEKALMDFNKSLEMDPKNAFAYSCRGDMFLKIKKTRQALIDFDSACQLQPKDAYYIARRANAHYFLNNIDKALEDCNLAIEIDEHLVIAYMFRYNIYLYLGEADKAEADAEIIDKLLAEEE